MYEGLYYSFFFQAEDGIRDATVTGVQTCALPIWLRRCASRGLSRPFRVASSEGLRFNGGRPTRSACFGRVHRRSEPRLWGGPARHGGGLEAGGAGPRTGVRGVGLRHPGRGEEGPGLPRFGGAPP